jgi:hypothetical protein
MNHFPDDIFTEPVPSVDTLGHLGPLTRMAGIWTSAAGIDAHPVVSGSERQAFLESMELQPIDAQTNGPQLFYGLRYHTRIVKPDGVETFHDQVGYWLWEPATGTVIQTIAIPRGQSALAIGKATPDALSFQVEAVHGSTTNGITSNPFLEHAFKTLRVTVTITFNPDGTWSYAENTLLLMPGKTQPFEHTDQNTLKKIGEPTPNPTALAAAEGVASRS